MPRLMTGLFRPRCDGLPLSGVRCVGYYRSNLRCRLRSPMRRADTYGLHLVMLYVGYVPAGTRVSMVESLPRRSVLAPYEGPVEPNDLRLSGYLKVAACRCSLGCTRGVPILACTFLRVVFLR